MDYVSIAAVTSYLKIWWLKQQKCINFQFRKSSKVSWQRLCSFRGSREESTSLPFVLLEATCIPWLLAFSSIFKANVVTSFQLSQFISLWSPILLLHLWLFCLLLIRTLWIHQAYLKILNHTYTPICHM